jgi:LysM repeat protein
VDFDVFKGTLEELYALAGGTAPAPVKYTIKAGDTFEAIARNFNVSLSELLSANPHLVLAGTVLTIPQPAGAGEEPDDPDDPIDIPDDPVVPVDVVTYVVKAGDTLTAIALKFGSSVKAIADFNHIQDPNLIYVGQVLKIPK